METRYILLPRRGFRSPDNESRTALLGIYSKAVFGQSMAFEALSNRVMTVHDSLMEDGPKLVTLDDASVEAINRPQGALRAVPEVIYGLPRKQESSILVSSAAGGTGFTVRVEDQQSRLGLPGVRVIAFDNYSARSGDEGTTDGAGNVALRLSGGRIERLYVVAPAGYWGGFRSNLPVANTTVSLVPLQLNYADAIRTMYPMRRFAAATGVRVGVLDTGVGPNTELNVTGGECTVIGQKPNDYQDIQEHGTHVAGLIGGRGVSGTGVRGLAPGVAITAYRVFEWNGSRLGASNYSILKAMLHAQWGGLDILNLSLGGGPRDAIVEDAITDACANGMLVVVAAGNDGRRPVSYPAAYAGALAVSAMGRSGTFPAGSWDDSSVQRPPHNAADPAEFLASFSNVGPQIACTGLGVGVLSTLPNNGFGPMSGTSMAAPMVAGCAASLLSQNPPVFAMPRDRQRSDAIVKLVQTKCVKRFNDPNCEGYGLPDPATV